MCLGAILLHADLLWLVLDQSCGGRMHACVLALVCAGVGAIQGHPGGSATHACKQCCSIKMVCIPCKFQDALFCTLYHQCTWQVKSDVLMSHLWRDVGMSRSEVEKMEWGGAMMICWVRICREDLNCLAEMGRGIEGVMENHTHLSINLSIYPSISLSGQQHPKSVLLPSSAWAVDAPEWPLVAVGCTSMAIGGCWMQGSRWPLSSKTYKTDSN